MKTSYNPLWKISQALLLAGLLLILVAALGQPGHLALAQEPDGVTPAATEAAPPDSQGPAVELVITAEPTAEPEPVETVEPEPSPVPVEPDDTGVIDPPSEEMLGEPVKDESYVSSDDVVDDEGGVIDIFDLSFVASQLGSNNSAADINLDGQVDIFDLSILASNYYDETGPVSAAAALPTPEPLPMVETGVEEFGALDLAVDPPSLGADAEASYVAWRPLRVGLGVNYVEAYDVMDGQSYTPPDLYAAAAVGRVWARTATWWNSYKIWPNWRLGWWRYASYPWTPSNAPDAYQYTVPVDLEIRDDDGRICYGYYGCRDRFELVDISSALYRRTKSLTFYPAACVVKDEAGVQTTGYWLDSGHNRCRITLQSWGTEWPRGYVSYFIDAIWD